MSKAVIIESPPGAPGASIALRADYEALRGLLGGYGDYLRTDPDRDFTDVSIVTYRTEAKRFLDWLEDNPQAITRGTFIQYRDYLRSRYSPATANLALVGARSFLAWLYDSGLIPENPALGIKGIKQRGRGRAHKRDGLTVPEVRRLLASIRSDSPAGIRDRAIIGSMVYGGLRTIEAQRALIGNYRTKGERRVLYLWGKGRKENPDKRQITEELIVIHPELEDILSDWISIHPWGDDPGAPLFPSLSNRSRGEALSTSAIRRMIKGAMRTAGIREASKSTHSLRHSGITGVIRGGGSLLQAQKFARHASPLTTQIYIEDLDRLENPPEFLIQYK